MVVNTQRLHGNRKTNINHQRPFQPIRECLAAVDSEGHQTEEDGDSDQRGGGRGGEKLPVLDLTVPQHRQHEDQQGHHQAAHVQGHLHLVRRPWAPRRPPARMLGDVAVQDAVVGQVQRGQGLGVVLQQLALVDQPDLLLLTRKVGPETEGARSAPPPVHVHTDTYFMCSAVYYCVLMCNSVWYFTVMCSTRTVCCAALCITVWYGSVRFIMVHYGAVRCSTRTV